MRSLLDSRAMSARSRRYGVAIAIFVTVAAYAWAKPPDEPPPPATPEAPAAEPVLTGEVTREQIEESVPDWVAEEVRAQPDPAAAQGLAAVPPGAEVTVYLGTWCGDSKRELPRLWRALDETGGAAPVAFRYVAVGRDKKEPVALTADADLLYVPTFVVARDGREVGRIVEESPHGVERDLLALLDGSARGVVSARDDLQPPQP